MPQLDPSVFAPQLVWLALTFGFLFVALAGVVLPRIRKTLTARDDWIAARVDAAAALRDEAEAARLAYEAALQEARGRALTVAQEMRVASQAEADAEKTALEAQLAEQMREADARLTAARDAALAGVPSAAADIVGDIVVALGGDAPDAAVVKTALDKAANA